MKKKTIYSVMLLALMLTVSSLLQAQNTFPSNGSVGIGTTTPAAEAILDISSTTKGVYLPRMTQAERNAIVNPQLGLIVFQTNGARGLYFYNGAVWAQVTKNAWQLVGNSGLNMTDHFIGTKDNMGVAFRTNNIERMRINENGLVSFGTQNISPNHRLTVEGSNSLFRNSNADGTSYVDIISGTTGYLTVGIVGGSNGEAVIWNRKNTKLSFGTNDLPRMTILNNGNVGIGEQSPVSQLHVKGAQNGITALTSSSNSGDTPFLVRSGNGSIEGMIVRGDGRVAMGTTTPATGYKLTVAGKIMCTELKVQLQPFPDYVFAKDYNLKTIAEVEQHINTYQRLPGMPSACEVEEGGLSVGEMTGKVVEKVEENTLYIIQLKKEIDALKAELNASKK